MKISLVARLPEELKQSITAWYKTTYNREVSVGLHITLVPSFLLPDITDLISSCKSTSFPPLELRFDSLKVLDATGKGVAALCLDSDSVVKLNQLHVQLVNEIRDILGVELQYDTSKFNGVLPTFEPHVSLEYDLSLDTVFESTLDTVFEYTLQAADCVWFIEDESGEWSEKNML